MDDFISRKAAIAEIARWIGYIDEDMIGRIQTGLKRLPSAQPEHTNSCYTNSWCIDCKEYDIENKCCPRYNMVIKQTLDEVYAHAETEAEARFHAEIVRCKECEYGEQDEYGRWFCRSLGCQIGNEDGSGYCADAERRTDD